MYLEVDAQTVFRHWKIYLRGVLQHVSAHMREHDPSAIKPRPVLRKRLVRNVILDGSFQGVRLADEQICLPGQFDGVGC